MNKIEVAALLDRPSPSSFGRVPFVQREQDGTLRVRGLFDLLRTTLRDGELQLLADNGHVLWTDISISAPLGTLVAGWIGAEFKSKAERIGATSPWGSTRTRDSRGATDVNGKLLGRFWLDSPESIYDLQREWIINAARQVFLYGDPELAELMERVLPDAEETQAAVWFSRKAELERKEELEWLIRLERDMERTCTTSELEQRFNRIRMRCQKSP